MIRSASLADLDALVGIENRAFDIDRFSRRSFRYLLTKANAATLVYEEAGLVSGYVIVLFHVGISHARMYSLAIDPQTRGKGIGGLLIEAAEAIARERDCISLRLEVRKDNKVAIRRYEQHGYRYFGELPDYYEDHMGALRFEKRLVTPLNLDLVKVPYYQQTLDFTCGPSALMMGMKALNSDLNLSRKLELRLWRETTTIFMTSGHGGCGPYGLALAAHRMGFAVELYIKERGTLFLDSVRSEDKKEVMQLVQEDFLSQLQALPVPIHYGSIGVTQLQQKFDQGGIPIVLISSYRIYQEKFPHWIVVTGFDDKYIYVHDPYVDTDKGKEEIDSINMPILKTEFEHMARYGKAGQKAAIILYERN